MLLIKIAALIFSASYFFLLLYFILSWVRKKKYFSDTKQFSTFVSIIIPARNEEENIVKVLNDIIDQDYPRHLFEIIVADDCSEDKTVENAQDFSKKAGADIKITYTKNDCFGKKNAIINGIKHSKGELIITTDADCRMGTSWLPTIIAFYEEKKPEMIIAPVCFHNEKTLFEKIQSLEFLSLTAITGASALTGNPLLCNGANLAYTKKAFFDVMGFAGNQQTPSGDDILLMLKFKKKFPQKIKYLQSKDAIVFTNPQKSISGFINQRKRWISKSNFYSDSFVISSSWLILLFNSSILAFFALHFKYSGFAEILIVSFSLKLFIDFLFLFLAASFFSRKSLLWLYVPAQIMYVFYVPFISIAVLIGNFTWKGRIYK